MFHALHALRPALPRACTYLTHYIPTRVWGWNVFFLVSFCLFLVRVAAHPNASYR